MIRYWKKAIKTKMNFLERMDIVKEFLERGITVYGYRYDEK